MRTLLCIVGPILWILGNSWVRWDAVDAGVIAISVGLILTITGCYLWMKGKNRHWAFSLLGIFAPISYLVLCFMADKSSKRMKTVDTPL